MKNIEKLKSFWNEEWVQVKTKYPTLRCNYEVSNYGRVKSIHKESGKENLLKGSVNRRGHRQINIRLADKKHGSIFVHRVVAENFVECPNKETHTYILHTDEDKTNNFHKNLKWVTEREWMAYHIKKGSYSVTHKSRYHIYKLNETKVAIIKKLLLSGKTKRKIIARNFGITETQIRRIEKGENWGYVKPMP